ECRCGHAAAALGGPLPQVRAGCVARPRRPTWRSRTWQGWSRRRPPARSAPPCRRRSRPSARALARRRGRFPHRPHRRRHHARRRRPEGRRRGGGCRCPLAPRLTPSWRVASRPPCSESESARKSRVRSKTLAMRHTWHVGLLLLGAVCLRAAPAPAGSLSDSPAAPRLARLELAPIGSALANTVASTYPVASASSSETYAYNPALDMFERQPGVAGPIFGERAETIGRGQLNVAASYSYVRFS